MTNDEGFAKRMTKVKKNFCNHLEMKTINKSLRGTAGLFKTADDAWQRRTKDLSAVHIELPVTDLVYLVEKRSARTREAPHPSALVADDEALGS
jgi:hypothetical protein